MRFDIILMLKIQGVVEIIAKQYNVDQLQALDMFYLSDVYQQLENTETGLYLRSPMGLYDLFQMEYAKKNTLNYRSMHERNL